MVVGENLACVHRWASRRLSWIDHCLNRARTRGPPYRSAERDRTRTNPFLHSSWATRSSASATAPLASRATRAYGGGSGVGW